MRLHVQRPFSLAGATFLPKKSLLARNNRGNPAHIRTTEYARVEARLSLGYCSFIPNFCAVRDHYNSTPNSLEVDNAFKFTMCHSAVHIQKTPCAEPHAGCCVGWWLETASYPIRHFFRLRSLQQFLRLYEYIECIAYGGAVL